MSCVSISHSHCFQFYLEACASWTLLHNIHIYIYIHITSLPDSNWFHSVSYQSTQHILLHLCHTETSWKQQGRWRGYERAIGCSQRRITEVSAAEGAEGVVERRYHVYWIVWSTMILFVTYLHYCTVPCIFFGPVPCRRSVHSSKCVHSGIHFHFGGTKCYDHLSAWLQRLYT